MKCENCGAEITTLEVNEFNRDGSDDFYEVPLTECEESAVVVETNTNWTGYELSEEEMPETVCCPKCRKFPFKSKEIQMYEVVKLVFFKEELS